MRDGRGMRIGLPIAIVAACLALAGWRIYSGTVAPRPQTEADLRAEALSQEQMRRAASDPQARDSEPPATQGGTRRLGSVGNK